VRRKELQRRSWRTERKEKSGLSFVRKENGGNNSAGEEKGEMENARTCSRERERKKEGGNPAVMSFSCPGEKGERESVPTSGKGGKEAETVNWNPLPQLEGKEEKGRRKRRTTTSWIEKKREEKSRFREAEGGGKKRKKGSGSSLATTTGKGKLDLKKKKEDARTTS